MAVATIDLIPTGYRDECRARQALKIFLPVFLLLLAGLAAARYQIAGQLAATSQALEQLRGEISFSVEQEARFDELDRTRQDLDQKVRVLEGLRGGLPAEKMFTAIDAAARGDTWFRSWAFRRQGEIVTKQPKEMEAAYLIVLSASAQDTEDRAWRLDTHMEISGSALDHSAIAAFVDRLQQRPEITDARILRTGSRREGEREIIDFELAISVGNNHGEPT